jgi:hypothetical protein
MQQPLHVLWTQHDGAVRLAVLWVGDKPAALQAGCDDRFGLALPQWMLLLLALFAKRYD